MTSNFYFGGSGAQHANFLPYAMKGLPINRSQTPHAYDMSLGGGGLNINRTIPPMDGDQSVMRSQTTRMPLHPDASQIGGTNNRQPLFSGVTQTNPYALHQNERLSKPMDRYMANGKPLDSTMGTIIPGMRRVIGGSYTKSRVLSNLHDTTNNTSNETDSSSFVFNRFGGAGGDNVGADYTNGPTGSHQSNTDKLMNISQPFAGFVSPRKQSSLISSQSLASSTANPIDHSSGKSKYCLTESGSQYYSDHQLNATHDLQLSGTLKSAAWILVPPVPESAGAHMYTGRAHELKSRVCNERLSNASYMDHDLKQVLHTKIQACLFTSDESTKEKLPRNLGAYTDLVPLENTHHLRSSVSFGFPTICFKAWSPRFNRYMLLRRVVLPDGHGSSLSSDAYRLAKQLSEAADHPAIVGFRDVFFDNAFGDNSAIMVYEFIPCTTTLQQTHMSDPMKLTSFNSPFNTSRSVRPHSSTKNSLSDLGVLHESTIWSYIVQLTHGLSFIHQRLHRACGLLDPSKILLQDGTRLRLNCLGLKDILFNDSLSTDKIAEDQAADFVQLAKLIIAIACGTSEAVQTHHRTTTFNVLQQAYRADLVSLIRNLLSGQLCTIDALIVATAPHVYDQVTRISEHSDFLERQLFLSMESDRLYRMICKLQSIVERTDCESTNPEWSETGDRYMLKLFRDFVFHQTDQLGAPYLDLAHITSALNKVEAGSSDRLCLISRDSQNAIIVSYADIKRWLDASFSHLVERHRQSRCELQLAQQREARQHRQQRHHSGPGGNDAIVDTIEGIHPTMQTHSSNVDLLSEAIGALASE